MEKMARVERADVVPFISERVELVQTLSEKITELYKDRPETVALIPKRDRQGNVVDYTPEITRPMALILWQYIVSLVQSKGGSVKEEIDLLRADEKGVIVRASVTFSFGMQTFTFCEIGESYTDEEDRDETPARRAYTRAFKRLIEKIVGEDFINRLLLFLTGLEEKRQEVKEQVRRARPASDKQIGILLDKWRQKKLREEHIKELIEAGELPEGFDIEKAMAEKNLTEYQASLLLEKAGVPRRKA